MGANDARFVTGLNSKGYLVSSIFISSTEITFSIDFHFHKLKNKGKTIFLNSHILSEVESLCDYYAVINKGELIEQGELSSALKNGSLEEHFYQLLSGDSDSLNYSEDVHE